MPSLIRTLAFMLVVLLGAGPAAAEPCRAERYAGAELTVCSFDLTKTDVRMAWRDADGQPFRTFDALAGGFKAQGETLLFAMNGGMYRDDLSPVGLYVENGAELGRINTASVAIKPEPNFYKKPNGVFYLAGGKAAIATTDAFLKHRPKATFATQSGPMLVIDGSIHPAFIRGSIDRKPRDGVGLSSPTTLHFVITRDGINFDDFAHFFRDRLGCLDALFLDGGSAPGLYAPELGRNDPPGHGGYGPMISVVGKPG